MQIDRLTLYHIRLPYVTPFQTSRWTETARECVLVRLDAEGLTAWGECGANQQSAYSYETTRTNWLMLEDFLVPELIQLVGQTFSLPSDSVAEEQTESLPYKIPLEIQAWRQAAEAAVTGHPMAKAGVEMALWDLIGQRQGRSLQQMVGGTRPEVAVGVSVGIQTGPQKLLEVVEGYLAQGYARIKLKIRPGRDLDETAAVRQAYPDLLLQVDGNSAYRLEDAPRLRRLDDFGLLLIEQPLGADDIFDHARLQPQLKTPLCLDESILSVSHARWALELGACRVINIKPARVGGIAEALALHDYCRGRGAPVWMGGMLETGIGRAANAALASLPGFTLPGDISASSRYFAEDLVEDPFILNPNSTLTVPTGPGLGVKVQEDAVEKVTLRKEVFKN